MTYSELKVLSEKLLPFKPTAEFKALHDRFNKATNLKQAISNFLKNQSFKTRGGIQEDKLDLKKATEILESCEKLKVTFENLDKFKERLNEIVDIISEINSYLESENNYKKIETCNKYLETLFNTGLEAPQILKLNQTKDYLEQQQYVEQSIRNLDMAEDNRKILEHLFKVGFVTTVGMQLMNECNTQIKWKRSIQAFQNIPETFSAELLMEGRLPQLVDVSQFNDLMRVPPQIIVGRDIRAYLESKNSMYLNVKRPATTASLKDKIKVAREIYASKIVDADKSNFLKSLQEELKFTMEVASIMTALNQTSEVPALQKIFEHPIPKARQVSLGYIERFLQDNSDFSSLMAHTVLHTQVLKMKEIVAEANDAVTKEDLKAIARFETELRDNLACQEVHARLRECLEFAAWREDSAKLTSAVEKSKDAQLVLLCMQLEEEINGLEIEETDEVCLWYQDKKNVLQKLYSKLNDFEHFERYDKLQKLVHDEKNFQPGKHEELRLELKSIKSQVDKIDTAISLLGDCAQEFVVPLALCYLGRAHHLRIRTKFMSDLVKKLLFVVESELETGPLSGLETLEDKLNLFHHLGMWTPHYVKLKTLKNWYKRSDEIAEKVIARATRQRIQVMSEVLDRMLHNTDEFEAKVYPEVFEICVKRREREDTFNYRPRREKKKNQFYATRGFDNKPQKTGKELVEEIIFNDYVNPQSKFCICNRVGYFKMIECTFCMKWFHIDCLKFNKSSLNKIKQFECPGCSLTKNNDYLRSIELHKSERTPLDEFLVLVNQVNLLARFVKLGDNQLDILAYYKKYTEIGQSCGVLVKQLDNFIEKSQEINFTSEVVKKEVESIVAQLSDYLIQLLGLPFFSPAIEQIALVIRKFNLIDRVYLMKDKKRVDLPDLYFIDAMRVGQSLKSEFLQKNVAHCEDVLESLAKIEELDFRKLTFPEYKKHMDKLLKNIKYTNLIERKAKIVENWPALQEAMRHKLSNPRNLTVRLYQEELVFFEKLPFVTEFPDIIRSRLKTIEQWRTQAKQAMQREPINVDEVQRLIASIQSILSPDDPELQWLNVKLKTYPVVPPK